MCRAVKCRSCGRTTWSGCGQHVAQVKARIPADNWCAGNPRSPSGEGGVLSRLLGRS